VSSVNDPPVISDLTNQVFYEDESLTYTISELRELVTDPDNPDSLLLITFGEGKHVYVERDPPDHLILREPANWFGMDTLGIIVSDGELSDTASVYVEVKSVNDIPYVDVESLPDTVKMIEETETVVTMGAYVMDDDLPLDNLSYDFDSSPDGLQLDFDAESEELTITAPLGEGIFTVRFSVTDDSSATVVDSFVVEVSLNPTAIGDLINGSIPTTYSLDQNYPNPFNPITHIKFGLPTAGYHQVDFEATDQPSGIYFYRIRSNEFQSVKKMMLLK
jgi:hypothetical protein